MNTQHLFRRSSVEIVLLSIIFFGVHTWAETSVWGIKLPYFIAALGTILYFSIRLTVPQISFSGASFHYLIIVAVLTLISLREGAETDAALAAAQLVYSMLIAMAGFHLVQSLGGKRASTWFFLTILVLTLLSAIEPIAPVKSLFERIRESLAGNFAYFDEYLQLSQLRDLQVAGAIRSTALAIEPSVAALSLMVLSFCYLWASPRLTLTSIFTWVLLLCVAAYFVRSPIFAAALLLGIMHILLFRSSVYSVTFRALLLVGAAAAAVSILYVEMSDRISNLDTDQSFLSRFTFPFAFLADNVEEFLFSGTGLVGGLDILANRVYDFIQTRGQSWVSYDYVGSYFSNIIALHFIYFGFAGGCLAMLPLLRHLSLGSVGASLFLGVQLIVVACLLGGYVSASFWFYCALLVSAARLSFYKHTESVLPMKLRPGPRHLGARHSQ